MLKDQIFADKKAKILVVEGANANRSLLTETIRAHGFSDVTGAPSLTDAIGILESEKVDWLITGLMGGDENALQILRLATQVPELRNLRVSLLYDDSEASVLPLAFQWGLLSVFKKPYTKESISAEMKTFVARGEQLEWQSSLISAAYLRDILVANQRHEDRIELEKNLIKVHPGRTEILFDLAAAYRGAGRKSESIATLKQVELIQPDLAERAKQLKEDLLQGEAIDPDDGTGKGLNILNLHHVIYVDSDTALHAAFKETMASIGVENVQCFVDGEQALEHIKANPNPDLIVHEWRIPKVTGPLFVQRAKSEGAPSAIYLVVSSLVQKEDVPLLKEMGIADTVAKPFERHQLLKSLVWSVQQDRSPTDQGAMERKIRQLLKDKNFAGAIEVKNSYKLDPKIPMGAKAMIEAEFAYAERNYDRAKEYAVDALKRSGDSILVLNLLGKIFMNLRDFASALKCFEKAQTMAPLNIERLCTIAEVQSEMGNYGKARDTIHDAKKVDADNVRVTEAEAKVELNAGNVEGAKKLMSQLEALGNVVSYMNNQAVTFSRSGHIDKGIEQYAKTLGAIPDEHHETKAIVTYNLALAYARANRLDEAKAELAKIGESKVVKKSKSLLSRVEQSLSNGRPLSLHAVPTAAESPAGGVTEQDEAGKWESASTLAAIEIRRGEIGCYLVFSDAAPPEQGKRLLDKPLRFKARNAIERSETMGADKNLKVS